MTSALRPIRSLGAPGSCSRPRSPGARTIKTFGAPGPVARITMIWWRLLTCLAASLVVARVGVLPSQPRPKGDLL
jgi:hypothetical protein